jgi:hypothetical protein
MAQDRRSTWPLDAYRGHAVGAHLVAAFRAEQRRLGSVPRGRCNGEAGTVTIQMSPDQSRADGQTRNEGDRPRQITDDGR